MQGSHPGLNGQSHDVPALWGSVLTLLVGDLDYPVRLYEVIMAVACWVVMADHEPITDRDNTGRARLYVVFLDDAKIKLNAFNFSFHNFLSDLAVDV